MAGRTWAWCGAAVLVLLACDAGPGPWHEADGYRWRELDVGRFGRAGFTALAPARTGITGADAVSDSALAYNRHLAQGSGVAMGDVDGDGLVDVYVARIALPNLLYRNLGDWRFEEVAAQRGVAAPDRASTGVALADADGDGDLDLFVVALGGPNGLWLNDGSGHFQESADAGLESRSGSTSLALADVDGDGDLDLYVANYKVATVLDLFPPDARQFDRVVQERNGRHTVAPEFREHYRVGLRPDMNAVVRIERGEPDAFYLNQGGGRFRRVPFAEGRFLDSDGRPLAEEPDYFGLCARFYDVDGDGHPDLYVCNDFSDPDGFWLNDGTGHFRAAPPLAVRASSNASMAVDFADIDRDGHVDFFVADMLARDRRSRLTQRPTHTPVPKPLGTITDRPQVQRNTLLLSRGDGSFAQIAEVAGVAASGWTWASLFLDVDLDGHEDLLLANGHRWDVMDGDIEARIMRGTGMDWRQERFLFPELRLPNVAFRNRGDRSFEDAGAAWRFAGEPDMSAGMAAADLDGDGDLDLVITRVNAPPLVLRNDGSAPRVAVRLVGRPPNTQGVGAKVRVMGGAVARQEKEVTAGGLYLSSSDYVTAFATGRADSVTVEVQWRDGGTSVVTGARPNGLYEIREVAAAPAPPRGSTAPAPPALFEDVSALLAHRHHEAPFDDYARQPLLPVDLSRLGPGISWIDADGDGHEDLLIGTGRGGALALFRNRGGRLEPVPLRLPPALDDYTTILPIPASDGMALLVGQAAYETRGPADPPGGPAVLRVLPPYPGETGVRVAIPGSGASPGPLALADYDGDGDLDLFVGARVIAGRWPAPAPSALFHQTGGRFELDTANTAVLAGLELVSAAVFSDIDGDGDPDLLLATDLGPVRVLRNHTGRFHDVTDEMGLGGRRGRWNGIATGDFDADGRPDIVVTGWGQNLLVRPAADLPLLTYYGDFDRNGSLDLIEARAERRGGPVYPLTLAPRVMVAIPALQRRVGGFASYAGMTVEELLGPRASDARVAAVNTTEHLMWMNRGARFEPRPLPWEAQVAPSFGVNVADADGDGREDLFLGQNFFPTELGTPRYDAGRGLWLLGDGGGNLNAMTGQASGVMVYGDQRGTAVADYDGDGRVDLAVTQNGFETKLYHNIGPRPGLRVRLVGPPGNPGAFGAAMRLAYDDRRGPLREVQAGSGYWSVNGAVQVLGMSGQPTGVWVRWPDGTERTVPPTGREVIITY